jgi:hypothetical protein
MGAPTASSLVGTLLGLERRKAIWRRVLLPQLRKALIENLAAH